MAKKFTTLHLLSLLCDVVKNLEDPWIIPGLARHHDNLSEALFAIGNLVTETDPNYLRFVLSHEVSSFEPVTSSGKQIVTQVIKRINTYLRS